MSLNWTSCYCLGRLTLTWPREPATRSIHLTYQRPFFAKTGNYNYCQCRTRWWPIKSAAQNNSGGAPWKRGQQREVTGFTTWHKLELQQVNYYSTIRTVAINGSLTRYNFGTWRSYRISGGTSLHCKMAIIFANWNKVGFSLEY